ncbi:MAG TPA: histidine kinase [Flavobacterium sp.]|nr:histidine kinase [Flavobacterium sp.]
MSKLSASFARIRPWFFHILIWSLLLSFPFSHALSDDPEGLTELIFRSVLIILVFYLNYFVLVPRLLLKKRLGLYILSIAGLIACMTYITLQSDVVPAAGPIRALPLRYQQALEEDVVFRLIPPLVVLLLHLTASTVFRVYIEWRKVYQHQRQIEIEKKRAEYNFMKAQLNPHFLFNSLNAIFSLAISKSEHTSDAVMNLSELMRYMIYDSDRAVIRLQDELRYIENYISLQRLRIGTHNHITFEVEGEVDGIVLPPLLFISFIENAFKYGPMVGSPGKIQINFRVVADQIVFRVVNTVNELKPIKGSSGIGLENTVARINHLFPGRNTLTITHQDRLHTVELTLELGNS